MQRKVFRLSAPLAVALFGAVLCPAASGAGRVRADRTVLMYAGKAVTYRDLTLLSYSELQRRLKGIARYVERPPGGVWPRVISSLFLARGPLLSYRAPKGATVQELLRGVSRNYIQSAVDAFLARRVLAEFAKRYPWSYRKHFHLSLLPKYNLAYARAWDAYNAVDAACERHHWTVARMAAAMKAAMPGEPKARLEEWAEGHITRMRGHPGEFLMEGVFPCERNGVVAPWFRVCKADIWLARPMRAAILARRAKFVRMVGKLFGRSHFVVCQNLGAADEPAAARIIAACGGPAGKMRMSLLSRVQLWLYFLGSPTEILPGSGGNYTYFSQLTGRPVSQIHPLAFIPTKDPTPSLLYIYQRTPSVNKALLSLRNSSFLWDVGQTELLKPICRTVLAKTQPIPKWLSLPALPKLIKYCMASLRGPRRTRLFGFPIPQLVRKKYRKSPW